MIKINMWFVKCFGVVVLALFLSSCFLSPYKMEVRQGNYLEQDMLMKLKAGMSKEQVSFILGTPLVIDPLSPNQWNYVYLSGAAGDVTRERTITVVFKDDQLERIDGDVISESSAND